MNRRLWLNAPMFSELVRFISLRYLRSRKQTQFLSLVSLIASLGTLLGVAVIITVLSVMNGFEQEIRNRILQLLPHASVYASSGHLAEDEPRVKSLLQHESVLAVAPFIEGRVMLHADGRMRGARLTAIDPEQEMRVSGVGQSLVQGSWQNLADGEFRVVIGSQLARQLGVRLGDHVDVVLPKLQYSIAGVFPRTRRFQVAGIFRIGAQPDNEDIYIHLADGQKLFRMATEVGGFRLKMSDMQQAPYVSQQLRQQLDSDLKIEDWSQAQSTLFRAIHMEKNMVNVLLVSILAVAGFNLLALLSMLVSDKRQDIAILKTLGATEQTIKSVFMAQGFIVTIVGTLFGVIAGCLLSLNVPAIVGFLEETFNTSLFNPQVYYITQLPAVLKYQDVVVTAIIALILGVLACWYPAKRASQIHPSEVLQ